MIINHKEIDNITNNIHLNEIYKNSVFLDIETTGFSKKYSQIISITFLYYEDGYKITQLFCQYKVDEPETLKYLRDIISRKKFIITYNGNSFDIPFLIEKVNQYNINIDFNSFIKIDLYSRMLKFKNKIQILNLKLKTLEKYFNINRNDTLSGKDILTLYEAYRFEPRKEFMYLILEHNYEDVFNLPKIMNNIIDLYDNLFYFNNLLITVDEMDISIKKNTLQCKSTIITDFKKDFINHNINYNMNLSVKDQTLEINIPASLYKDENIEACFLNRDDYKITNFTSIKGIKRNLVPIKFNGKTYHDNIMSVIENILNENFNVN